jgi:hypothetical protein
MKKTIDQILIELYDENLYLFRKGYFQIQYKNNHFRVYQEDGSYEGSFQTLIHYILFHENLYQDHFSLDDLEVATHVLENHPDLPPAFDDESSNELFDVFVYNATEFTYQYMKDNHLYCEAMNKMIQDYGYEWALLRESD